MNIFASDNDPCVSARALDDKRLIKMTLETAQIISAVAHRYGNQDQWYKLTHAKHPCVLWAGDTRNNLRWLLCHGEAMADEYFSRFSRFHKSASVIYRGSRLVGLLSDASRTPFVNCTTYRDMPVVQAYQTYLCDKWRADKIAPKWTNSQPPHWFIQ